MKTFINICFMEYFFNFIYYWFNGIYKEKIYIIVKYEKNKYIIRYYFKIVIN